MNKEHKEQCTHLDGKLDELEGRLDRHLEIYANNGKESARVANALEKMILRSNERDKKVDEMFDAYSEFKAGKRTLKWLFGLFMAVGGAVLLIKGIIK